MGERHAVSLTSLLDRLSALDVRLWAEDGQLRFTAPKGVIQGELRETLLAQKAALIARLSDPAQGESYPAAPTQEMLWSLSRMASDCPALYIEARAADVAGALRADLLQQAVDALAARHPILRTRLRFEEDRLRQFVLPPGPFPVEVRDLRGAPPAAVDAAVADLAWRPFELEGGPLARFGLVRYGEEQWVLVLSQHHCVTDRWSAGLLVSELSELYSALAERRAVQLPPLSTGYGQYAAREQAAREGARHRELLAYWTEMLTGAPPLLALPTDRPYPSTPSHHGSRVEQLLSPALATRLAALCRQRNLTPFMVLSAAFAALLHRLGGQETVVLGTPIAHRQRPELERIAGCLINTLALRFDPSPRVTFAAMLEQARERTLAAFEHQDLPFADLVRALRPDPRQSHAPIYQAMIAVQNGETAELRLGDLRLTDRPLPAGTAKFPLLLTVLPEPAGTRLWWDYQTDLFDTATITRLSGEFETLLAAGLDRPETPLGELRLMGEADARELLAAAAPAPVPYPRDRSVPDLFAERAAASRDRVALVAGSRQTSYGELDRQATRLADRLRREGVRAGDVVAVKLPRSPESIVALVAVLKAGGVYLPLDEESPEERLRLIVREAAPRLLIADSPLPWAGVPVLPPDDTTGGGHDIEPFAPVAAEAPACLMYTSGSTGRPKGVLVPHRAIVRLVMGTDFLPFGPHHVFLHLAPAAFDASTLEIWGALLHGARLVLAPPGRDALGRLGALVREHGVTVLWLTSGLFSALMDTAPGALRGLPFLLTGGDVLSPRAVAAALNALPGTTLLNGYGPTENATFTTVHRLTPGAPILIGAPIANTTAHVLDAHGAPAPEGVTGQLWVGGDGLAVGYLGQPEATRERFVTRRLAYGSSVREERLYATGDLARWCRDAAGRLALAFQGRMDRQVKIRGFRVEPGELEACLAALPDVAEAAVVVERTRDAQARLVGVYVPAAGCRPDPESLRSRLADSLPSYMLPQRLVALDSLPVNDNGKIDRAALEALAAADRNEDGAAAAPDEAPTSETERAIAAVWARLLGRSRIGRHDDFFALGGHSLLAVRMVAALAETLTATGCPPRLDIRSVFEHPTPATLAAAIDAAPAAGADADGDLPAPRGLGDRDLPLSYAQERLWTLEKMMPMGAAYVVPGAFRLRGPLDLPRLERAFGAVLARHPGLSVVFEERDGRPVQHLVPPPESLWPLVDLAPERLESTLAAFAAEPFDLESGPPWRAAVYRLGADDHVLALALHHLVCDGWSIGVLLRDLGRFYAGDDLPPAPLPYPDFADWHRAWMTGARRDRLIAAWHSRLDGLPDLELPLDFPRPPMPSSRGVSAPMRVEARAVDEACRAHGITRFMLCAAALGVLLQRLSGQDEVAIATPVAGRHHPGIAETVGLFAETLVLRLRVDPAETVAAFLARVRGEVLSAFEVQDLPFSLLVEALRPERRLDKAPLVQTMLAVDDGLTLDLTLPGLEATPVAIDLPWAKYDLSVNVRGDGAWLAGAIEVAADLFGPATAAHFGELWSALLTEMAGDPDRAVRDLDARPETERTRPAGLAGPRVDHPTGGGVHRLIEARAAQCPDAVALVAGDETVTHGALDLRARRLATHLRRAGLQPGQVAGLYLRRGIDRSVALLAVLKCGAVVLPLNPDHPPARLDAILDQARPAVILCTAAPPVLPEGLAPVLVDPAAATESDEAPESVTVAPEDPAYVMFTSGSTGRPKGVVVPHRALANYLGWFASTFGLGESDVMVQSTGFDFDPAMLELLAPLLTGGRLVLPQADSESDAIALAGLIRARGVTVVQTVPSLYQVMVAEDLLAGCDRLRVVVSGGEALSPDLMRRLMAAVPSARVFNLYGPTETCIDALGWQCRADWRRATVPLGYPIHNVRVLVVDDRLQPVADGLPGELAIAGANLALGYLGDPRQTARAFPSHSEETGGERLYRTGDRVRLGAHGIEFLGRIDRQFKLRGMRIEAGEVETALAGLPMVRESAVVVAHPGTDAAELVAAISTADPAAGAEREAELRRALRERLPAALVPARYLWLDRLPRRTSGKVDHDAVTRLAELRREVRAWTPARPPRGETERAVAAIWAEVLGAPAEDVDQDFFAAGGHSLKAVQVASRMRARWNRAITVREVFEHPTIAGLSALVADERIAPDAAPTLQPVPRRADAQGCTVMPVSRSQRALWFLDRLEGGAAAYTTVSALRLEGRVDIAAIERALAFVAARHEALHTRFALDGDETVQVIDPALRVPVTVETQACPDIPERLAALARAEGRRAFDLERQGPIRFRLVPLEGGGALGLLAWHHIATDAWSQDLFVKEFGAALAAFAAGADAPALPPLALHYGDYAAWQQAWLASPACAHQLEYWRHALDGAPQSLTLFADRPRPPRQSFRGGTVHFRVAPALAARLRDHAHRTATSPYMVGLAAFLSQLHRQSGQDDILVGSPVANRPGRETEAIIGFFANTLVLRGRLHDAPAFDTLLERVRDTVLGAFAHADLPFETLVDALNPARSLAQSPLFQVMFNLLPAPAEPDALPGLTVRPVAFDPGIARFDILLTLVEARDGGLDGHWEYSEDLFGRATAEAMANQYVALLAAALVDPTRSVATLPLLSAEGASSIAAGGLGPVVPGAGDGLLHALFEEQVARTPDATAVEHDGGTVSYRVLDARASVMASRLVAAGVKPGEAVGLFFDRSPEMLVALLAVLKAGGAYLPLDPALPEARRATIAEEARLTLALCVEGERRPLPPGVRAMKVPVEESEAASFVPPALAGPEDTAYILFTSGSTGRPKGVRMPHRALVNLVRWQVAQPGFTGPARTLQFTTLAFDVATQEIFSTWATGGTLVLIEEALRRDMPGLIAFAADRAIDRLFLPFTALQQMAEAWPLAPRRPASLRALVTAGERLRVTPALRAMVASLPGCRLVNQYGPTETHVATACVLPEDPADWPDLPSIGRPIANTAIRILDKDGGMVPPGVPGQIWIAGSAVGHGYVNQPDLTQERFMPDPFEAGTSYATGDLGRWRREADGGLSIEFLGRLDQQTKIRGFRVEPEEIEHALTELESVALAAVTACPDRHGEARLVADIVPAPGFEFDAAALRTALARRLPDYMIPTSWRRRDSLPRTASGKTDRRALPPPDAAGAPESAPAALEPPGTATEEKVMAIWRSVLDAPHIGRHVSFFELGGTSFLLVRVLAELRRVFPDASHVTMVSLFEHPTVAALAALVDGGAPAATPDHRAGDRRARLAERQMDGQRRRAARRTWEDSDR